MTTADDPSLLATSGRAATARAPAPKTVRDPRLDFFRGIAMFIILCAHTPQNFFTSWIPARWGFSDATEIFVFCSGMASAIAFGKAFEQRGWLMGTARVSHRVWQVYWSHIGMFFAIAAFLAGIDAIGDFEKSYINTLNLTRFYADASVFIVGLFTLTYVPNYFDILPMYLVILAMMPILIALQRVSFSLAAATVIIVWFLAQSRMLEWFGWEGLHFALPAELPSDYLKEREISRTWFFNPFGWQLVFFTGFALMRGWIPAPPVKTWLIALCAVIVLMNVPFSSIGVREFNGWALSLFGADVEWQKFAREWRIDNRVFITKSDFGLFRYLHFLAVAYLAWVAAGHKGHRLIATGAGFFSDAWRGFVAVVMKVGQQSLAVFIFSMFFARFIGFMMDIIGRTTLKMTIANLIGFLALILVAYSVAWFKSQPWRKKVQPA